LTVQHALAIRGLRGRLQSLGWAVSNKLMPSLSRWCAIQRYAIGGVTAGAPLEYHLESELGSSWRGLGGKQEGLHRRLAGHLVGTSHNGSNLAVDEQ
jgi:hypothetical protein